MLVILNAVLERYQCGPDALVQKQFNIKSTPHFVLVDKDGVIVWMGDSDR